MRGKIAAAAAVLAGCAPYVPPPAGAPLCPNVDQRVYIVMGRQLSCRLNPGQHVVVKMARNGENNGWDNAMNVLCFDIFHGTVFVVRADGFDYCGIGGAV